MDINFVILLVEDEAVTRKFIHLSLDGIFDEILIANDGKEGLKLFNENQERITLIISDITMPNMNGIEMSRMIRKQNRDIPIILLTAHDDASLVVNALNAGVNHYMLKPIDHHKLLNEVIHYRNEQIHKDEVARSLNLLKQYKSIIDDTTILSKTDLTGKITYANDEFYKISGYTEDELIGSHHNIVRHPDTEKNTFKDMWKTIKNGKNWSGNIKNRAKNGSTYYTKAFISPIKNHVGKIIEYIAIRHDITEIVEARNNIEESQREMIYRMGEIGETRSKETGQHVKRVAEYSYLLAILSGLSEKDSMLLKNVSPMHDIGKVAIADAILNKAGVLTDEEFNNMKNHSIAGYDLLSNSNQHMLQAAAIVAYEHHEKYDGTGYPNGKKAEDIHIYGCITVLADVFDALGSDRVYKKAWELEDILLFIKENRATHFDPKLVDLFFNNLDKFLDIRNAITDNIQVEIACYQ